jgi:carbamoyl-phosphate synthase large subunit
MAKRILVTACGGPAGINTLRLLSQYPDLELFGVDVDPLSAGQLFAREFRVVRPFRDRKGYEEDLLLAIADWNIDVVIPTLADELGDIHDMLIGAYVDIALSPKEVTQLCGDKAKFYEWASATFSKHMVKWQTLDAPLAWDAPTYFLKPVSGRGSVGCRLVTKSELEVFVESHPALREWIVMEPLIGVEWTVDVYVRQDGVPLYVVPRERIEVVSGISRKGKTVRQSEVIAGTLDVLSALPFRGPVCIQWKADEHGVPKLMEVNARMSGGVMITVLAGANPMELLHREILGESPSPIQWSEVTALGYTEFAIIPIIPHS